MKLISLFDPKLFKNPDVAAAVSAILKLEDGFVRAGRGSDIEGYLISLAQVFREENDAILAIITKYQDSSRLKNKSIKPIQKVSFVNSSEAKPFSDQDDCIGCNKDHIPEDQLSEPEKTQKRIEAGLEESEWVKADEDEEFDIEKLTGVKSFRDVLNAFSMSGDEMKEFCKLYDIKIGRTKDPILLSKKIFKYLESEGISK